jgi:glycosyltransferase involved in cell wall biosynthesis
MKAESMKSIIFPKISVITPAYNASTYLSDLLLSVANQNYPNFEHILINDGSDDDGKTESILKDTKGIIWWSHSNIGQYATINKGIDVATGDYIIVISADDYIASPCVFSNIMKQCIDRNADIVYGHHKIVDSNGVEAKHLLKPIRPVQPILKHLLKYKGYVSHIDMFVSRQHVIDNDLWWNPKYRYSGDWEWVARTFSCAKNTLFVNQYISCYRRHPGQISVEKGNAELRAQEVEIISKAIGGNPTITNMLILADSIKASIYRRTKRCLSKFNTN